MSLSKNLSQFFPSLLQIGDNPPFRDDILLYEHRSKKVLDRKLVSKVEDLCTWINQHPSHEIVIPALPQSTLLTVN